MNCSTEEEILPNDLVHGFLDDEVDNITNCNDFGEICHRELNNDELELDASEGNNWMLNRRYRNYLQELRRVIISNLQRCKQRQVSIEKRILDINTPALKPPSRKNWYNLFGYPYFKDRHFFPCPINVDVKEKWSKNEIDYHQLPPIRRWVEADCLKLEEAVKANAVEMKTYELMKQRGIVLEKLKNPKIKSDEKKSLSNKLFAINREIDSVKDMSPAVLYGDINKRFDWLKITAEAFGEFRSSEEVEAMWVLCRHPSINRRHWTKAENKALMEIASRNKGQDWAMIAAELDKNRSEFQCIIQYQRHLNTDMINHKWTDEEDELLRLLVEKCRVGDFIPWATVTMCMSNRTRSQVYNRWQYSVNPIIKKGRFTTEEDCLIMAGVKRFGTDFTRVSTLVPGRTTAQVYARYMQCLVRIGPLGRWTKEEDALLIKLVDEDGCKKWYELTKFFKHRSRNQVRHRYLYLKEWIGKNQDVSVEDAPRRDLGDYSQRNSILWSKIQNALESSPIGNMPKRNNMELNDDDLAVLKMTMSQNALKGKVKCGRKLKSFSRADKLLDEFGRVSYLLNSGRRKVIYAEEDKQQRFKITMKILQALQVYLAFPFDESVIEEDDSWNDADVFILQELKKKYDKIHSEEFRATEIAMLDNSSKECSQNVKSDGSDFGRNFKIQNFQPLYSSGVKIYLPFPEVFPCNLGNIVGFRTMLLSRNNLKTWKTTPKKDVIAITPERPPSLKPGEKIVKRFAKEESGRLFAERLFALFMWPTNLARILPSINRDMDEMEESESNVEQINKKGPKRTIQHVAKAKSKMMKERWMKCKEENRKRKGDEKAESCARKKAKVALA